MPVSTVADDGSGCWPPATRVPSVADGQLRPAARSVEYEYAEKIIILAAATRVPPSGIPRWRLGATAGCCWSPNSIGKPAPRPGYVIANPAFPVSARPESPLPALARWPGQILPPRLQTQRNSHLAIAISLTAALVP